MSRPQQAALWLFLPISLHVRGVEWRQIVPLGVSAARGGVVWRNSSVMRCQGASGSSKSVIGAGSIAGRGLLCPCHTD